MSVFDFKSATAVDLNTVGFLMGATSQAAATPSIFTATTTGSGNVFALATSPTLVTPTLGVATATTINKVALTAPATGSTLTIADGKTATFSNSITFNGTDSTTMTFPASSTTLAGLSIANTFTAQNTFAQGTLTASAPFTLTQTLNNAGVTFETFVVSVTNTASAANSAIVAAKVGGSNLFALRKDGDLTFAGNGGVLNFCIGEAWDLRVLRISSNGFFLPVSTGRFVLSSAGSIGWSSGTSGDDAEDLFLTRNAAASLQLGVADAAAPVAQTLRVQSVVAGTTDTAGAAFTIAGSVGTGTGTGGAINFQVAPAGTTGSTQNSLITPFSISGEGQATFAQGTLTASAPFTLTQTWNASATFNGVVLNYTLTTWNDASKFLDIQRAGTSKIYAKLIEETAATVARNAGLIGIADQDGNTFEATRYEFGWALRATGGVDTVGNRLELFLGGSGNLTAPELSVRHNGSSLGAFIQARNATDTDGIRISFTDATYPVVCWSSTGPHLVKESNTQLVMRDINTPGNAQLLEIANTWTVGGIREFLRIGFDGNRAKVLVIGAGGGTQRPLDFDGSEVQFQVGGTMSFATNTVGRVNLVGTTAAFGAIERDGAGIKVVGGDGTSVGWVKVPSVAVSALPAASTAGEGARSFVTDADTPVFGSTVTGGGSTNVPVYSDGTNWIVG